MERLFISYARHDVDAVRTLARDVRDFEYDVWFDQEIAGGQRWWDDILRRVRECDVFLFAVSHDSLNSEACMAEFNYALALGKPVLPVLMADNVRASQLPSRLGAIQFINCAHQDKEACKSLIKAIRHLPRPGDLPSPLPDPPSVPVSYFMPLREQVCSREQLSLDQQSQIVMKLRWRFDQGVGQERPSEGSDVADEVSELLHLLLRRDDLYSKAADDARALLERISAVVPTAGTRPVEPCAPAHTSAAAPASGAGIPAAPEAPLPRGGEFCPNCRTPVESGAKFCSSCGSARAQPCSSQDEVKREVPGSKCRRFPCASTQVRRVIVEVKDWLESQAFETQEMSTESGSSLLQVKKRGGWRDFLGMGTSLNIVFHHSGDMLTVEIGAGKWIDKAAAGTVSMLLLWPLAITAGYGAWEQARTPERVFDYVGQRLTSR
jgi:hypothetical protein